MSIKSKAFKWLGNTVFDLGDVVAKVKHPTWKRYYHGANNPFDILKFNEGPSHEIGLHATRNYDVANYFAQRGRGPVYKFYAPKPTMEVSDFWNNNTLLFKGPTTFRANPYGYTDATTDSKLFFDMLERFGGKNSFEFLPLTDPRIQSILKINPSYRPIKINKDIVVNSELVHWPNRPPEAAKRIDAAYDLHKSVSKENPMAQRDASRMVTQTLADFGHPVIKYANRNPMEGGKFSYIITDPTKMYIPQTIPVKTWHLGAGLGIGTGVLGGYLWNKKDQQ